MPARKPSPYDKPKKAVFHKIKVPPCPDPALFVAVRGKDGNYFWRRRRGTVTPAVLNPVMADMAKYMKPSMAAAAELIQALEPFTCSKAVDGTYSAYSRNAQRFAALFSKSMIAVGKMGWSYFYNVDLNPNCRLNDLMKHDYEISLNNNMATLKILLSDNMVDKLRDKEATHFYFELILISGDPAKKNSLRSEHDISEDYPYKNHSYFDKGPKRYCELSVIVPEKKPAIIILKAATRAGRFTTGPNHEGLKVLGWR